MSFSTTKTKLQALASPPACDHDGTCSGMLTLSDGRRGLKMEVVCDACGAKVRDLGEMVYDARPQVGDGARFAA